MAAISTALAKMVCGERRYGDMLKSRRKASLSKGWRIAGCKDRCIDRIEWRNDTPEEYLHGVVG